MSRITKEIAKKVALKLTENKRDEINALEKKLSDFCHNLAKAEIPKDILTCYNKNKQYFNTASQIRFVGNGTNHETVSFSPELPNLDSWYITVTPSKEVAKEFIQMFNDVKIKKREKSQLQDEIENALILLGTYKKVETEFKEAFELLPTRVNNQLIVNVSEIRKKL